MFLCCTIRSAIAAPAVPASAATFPSTGLLFVGLLVAVVFVVGALTFFPAFALGPLLEHLMLR